MSVTRELRDLIVTLLRADADVGAVAGDRIYPTPPPLSARTFPDVTLGPTDFSPDDAEGITGREMSVQVDCWTREPGQRSEECERLVDAVYEALHEADASLTTNALAFMRVELTRVFMDPDGQTAHGVLTVSASVET